MAYSEQASLDEDGRRMTALLEANKRIAELEVALEEAIEGWEEGAAYKGDYLREKHGDAQAIAKARAVLRKSTPVT